MVCLMMNLVLIYFIIKIDFGIEFFYNIKKNSIQQNQNLF